MLVDESFPEKLHRMLEETSDAGLRNVVSWTPKGNSFCIFDKERFAQDIMPRYFNSNRFLSLQRSLNLWGFKTETTQVLGVGQRWHPLFLRGKPEMCKKMMRTKRSRKQTRQEAAHKVAQTIKQSHVRCVSSPGDEFVSSSTGSITSTESSFSPLSLHKGRPSGPTLDRVSMISPIHQVLSKHYQRLGGVAPGASAAADSAMFVPSLSPGFFALQKSILDPAKLIPTQTMDAARTELVHKIKLQLMLERMQIGRLERARHLSLLC